MEMATEAEDPVAERFQSELDYLERQVLELADTASDQGYNVWAESNFGECIVSRWGASLEFTVRKKEPRRQRT